MTQIEAVQLWLNGAGEALETAQVLLDSHRFDHALFFGQLYLEKLLKAVTYHIKDDHPLYTHDLTLLAKKCDLPLTNEQVVQLDEITSFNTTARYPEQKQHAHGEATPEYAKEWLKIIKSLGDYFKSFIQK